MNLIVTDHKLDKQQEKAIYELTLKKKRNKKSTISHKQMAALQQLANELLAERIDTPQMIDCTYDYCIDCVDYYVDHRHNAHNPHDFRPHNHHHHHHHHHHQSEQQQQQQHHQLPSSSSPTPLHPGQSQCQILNSSFISSTTSASSSSSSSTSTSTSTSATTTTATTTTSSLSTSSITDDAAAKLNRLRLEQLNNELERRLHQYEYLVAQEKAILGTYNISLFAKESVSNFKLDLKK